MIMWEKWITESSEEVIGQSAFQSLRHWHDGFFQKNIDCCTVERYNSDS